MCILRGSLHIWDISNNTGVPRQHFIMGYFCRGIPSSAVSDVPLVPSSFDVATQLTKIYQINDFLLKLNAHVDWERFRKTLEKENAIFKSCPENYERKLHYAKELKKKS